MANTTCYISHYSQAMKLLLTVTWEWFVADAGHKNTLARFHQSVTILHQKIYDQTLYLVICTLKLVKPISSFLNVLAPGILLGILQPRSYFTVPSLGRLVCGMVREVMLMLFYCETERQCLQYNQRLCTGMTLVKLFVNCLGCFSPFNLLIV